MAKAPKCKVCGVPHWANEPHQWSSQRVEAAKALTEVVKAKPPPLIKKAITEAAIETAVEMKVERGTDALAVYLAAEKAKKAAYMREYRARKKAEK